MCTDKQCQRVPCLLDRIEKLEATVAQLSNNKTIQMYQYTKPEPPLKTPSATIFDVTDAEMYLIRDGRTVQDIIDLRAKKSAMRPTTSYGFIA